MTGPNLTHWPERLPKHLPLPETSLWFNLEVAATRYPYKTAIVFYDTALSYAELKRSAEHLAGFLQQRCAVGRGDRVAQFLHNRGAHVGRAGAQVRRGPKSPGPR